MGKNPIACLVTPFSMLREPNVEWNLLNMSKNNSRVRAVCIITSGGIFVGRVCTTP